MGNEKFKKAMAERGVKAARAFPPMENWTRLSVGLPEEMAVGHSALPPALGRHPWDYPRHSLSFYPFTRTNCRAWQVARKALLALYGGEETAIEARQQAEVAVPTALPKL